MIEVKKWDEGGYYMIIEDGFGIARSKSFRQAQRIMAALTAATPTESDPLDEDRPTYRQLVDLLRRFSVAGYQAAEELQVEATDMVRQVDETEVRP